MHANISAAEDHAQVSKIKTKQAKRNEKRTINNAAEERKNIFGVGDRTLKNERDTQCMEEHLSLKMIAQHFI
jgi:hypothetical protein